ncbi:zinc ribbon domain-containing protein [Streptomyces sp. AS58]|uniref:zinc ribbon domain-containing protein n=1 Tax=Streptomyces sp. AS58 TaxID=1519489 RepID=UPI003B632FE8
MTSIGTNSEPISQVCSACGYRDRPKPLHVRQWTSRACGTTHDRDHNAALNVLAEGRRLVAAGRAETLNASWSAGKTRTKVPAQRVEAGSPRKGQTTRPKPLDSRPGSTSTKSGGDGR